MKANYESDEGDDDGGDNDTDDDDTEEDIGDGGYDDD